MLTQKQRTLLYLIDRKIQAVGVPPSYDEMKDALGLASKSGIHRLITALEERGFIRRLPNKARAIEVIRHPQAKAMPTPQPENDSVTIPFVGKIAAGNPILALEQAETFSVPAQMIGQGEHFALTVSGDSMQMGGILDGDIVIIKKVQTAHNNDIVVALIDQEEATLKKFRKTAQTIELIPENLDYEIQVYTQGRVQIQGVMVGLIRHYHAPYTHATKNVSVA